MKLSNISRRSFLITFVAILGSAFFLKQSNFFSKNTTFNKELYFSSFCALIDNQEEFISNYNLNKPKKKIIQSDSVRKIFC